MDFFGLFEFDHVEVKVLVHVVVAMILGAVVGLDRELHSKPAGLRTNMLVAGSAALLVWCGRMIVPWYGLNDVALGSDPLRIIGAIITGVSFLGAGTGKLRIVWRRNPRAAENDDRGLDVHLQLHELRLGVLQGQSVASHFRTAQEVGIPKRQSVAWQIRQRVKRVAGVAPGSY